MDVTDALRFTQIWKPDDRKLRLPSIFVSNIVHVLYIVIVSKFPRESIKINHKYEKHTQS